jgi:DNA-binding CsgD family transcriptional regulator
LGNFIEVKDYGFENIIENEFHRQIRVELEEVMNEYLTLREREIIKFIYGWDCEVMNGEEVAELLNITRERVRQARENALRKIRNTSWWMTKGKFYALEIKGLVYTKRAGRTLSYREVEKDYYSIETIQDIIL